ncbi:hypothetical protein [Methylomonas fluvii]|uniref:Lipoprotein n=1 Tax=Methylomonas fluvii TaxID=1854564 RepID=A0ABR9D9B3_9GAMM|nr:hypothetical protein [Methylomonas fluvii]MBD9359705.1 hypothetical protein [Methylomonas fluvii]CAD6872457.1 hypothetical protein [Methylomonas fluvii]
MKTIQVSILTIAVLTLSGCATGYYQRDYGYGSAYSSPGYYQSYGRSYSSPSTSITYGRYYVQPSYRPEHHHDDHHDWHLPAPHFDHRVGGWQGRDLGRRDFDRERHTEQRSLQQQSMPERQERGFGRRDSDGDHQRGGWGGRFGRRGD